MPTTTVTQPRSRTSTRTRVLGGLAVVAGGLLGSAVRATIATALPMAPGEFPVTTLLINLAGALLLGVFLARHRRLNGSRWSLRFWAMGALGSFTTFSAFSVEVFQLLDAGSPVVAAWYVGFSTIGGVIAALWGDSWGSRAR